MNRYVGIIVDGHGDYSSLKMRFKERYIILKTDGPHGHTAKPRAIAKKSRKQVGILAAYPCAHVIILLDFEMRTQPYENFVTELRNLFECEDFPVPVSVVMPNRMIENWYLADIEFLSSNKTFLRNKIKQKDFEGEHGKNRIKSFMRPGVSYSETKHGPEMFKIIRFGEARRYSKSFDEFLNKIF